ncbi:hypothetical protein LAZ67_17000653 [Cordylochernes scorpioides]|uniref:Uncharacterized protein n=1 Tax=Cordylochernes scorpioides TaxID=51811 RepID=A0ABY6LCV1_9ARAC|nr:hypothetical protein LAZ67_17000653 [Cordylochernes scorpioides]
MSVEVDVLQKSYLQNCRYNSQAAPPDGDRLKLAAPPLLTLGRRVSHSMMQQKTLSLGIAASTTCDMIEEQGEIFHQDIKTTEERYQGRWDIHMMADYCWNLQRDCEEKFHAWKSYKRSFQGHE